MSPLDLDDLRVFLEVARRGSFSDAARVLALSQPAVSRRVRKLERELGVALLDRRGSPVTPTRPGFTFLAFARRVLEEYEAIRPDLRGEGQLQGSLHVTASTTPGEYLCPGLFARFLAAYPGVGLSLHVMDSAAVERSVEENQCDLGFLGRPPRSPTLRRWPVAEDEIVLAVPLEHPFARRVTVAVEELAGQPFVVRAPGSATREVVERAVTAAGHTLVEWRPVLQTSSVRAQLAAIAAGQGIGFVSRLAVGQGGAPCPVATVTLAGLPLRRWIYLVASAPRLADPACRAFLGFVLEATRARRGRRPGRPVAGPARGVVESEQEEGAR